MTGTPAAPGLTRFTARDTSVHTLGTSLWTGAGERWSGLGTDLDEARRPQGAVREGHPCPQVVPRQRYGLTSGFGTLSRCPPGLVLPPQRDKGLVRANDSRKPPGWGQGSLRSSAEQPSDLSTIRGGDRR